MCDVGLGAMWWIAPVGDADKGECGWRAEVEVKASSVSCPLQRSVLLVGFWLLANSFKGVLNPVMIYFMADRDAQSP